jgi:hypothetical protein
MYSSPVQGLYMQSVVGLHLLVRIKLPNAHCEDLYKSLLSAVHHVESRSGSTFGAD